MREIKFRAWDGKGMTTTFDMTSQGGVRRNLLGTPSVELSYYKLMQFTGLKDKNGREIYEGDILQKPNERDKVVVKYGIQKIIDNEGYSFNIVCGFFMDDMISEPLDDIYRYSHMDDIDDYLVIGNIYENPNLLTSGIGEI